MFGDVGHGMILLICGIILMKQKTNNLSSLHSVKYLIFEMGIFAIYTGLIYNEFFGKPLLIFKTCDKRKCIYPFGIDWIWSISENETEFNNSFKMKFSIIIGVFHMILGIFCKILNSIYFK